MKTLSAKFITSQHKVMSFIISLCYAIFLCSLPLLIFKDRANYLVYASSSLEIATRSLSKGLVYFFANEPVWLGINILSNLFLDGENTIRFIIFFSSILFSYKLLNSNPKHLFFLVTLLFFPLILKNNIIHLRQGLAITLFLVFWTIELRNKWFLFILLPLIHSSFFIIIFVYFYANFIKKINVDMNIKIFAAILCGFFVVFSLELISVMLETRQANNFIAHAEPRSGGAFIFWFVILLLFILEGKSFIKAHLFEIIMLIIFLLAYFTLNFSSRILESCMVIICMAGLSLKTKHRLIYQCMMILMSIVVFIRAAYEPCFGFCELLS